MTQLVSDAEGSQLSSAQDADGAQPSIHDGSNTKLTVGDKVFGACRFGGYTTCLNIPAQQVLPHHDHSRTGSYKHSSCSYFLGVPQPPWHDAVLHLITDISVAFNTWLHYLHWLSQTNNEVQCGDALFFILAGAENAGRLVFWARSSIPGARSHYLLWSQKLGSH